MNPSDAGGLMQVLIAAIGTIVGFVILLAIVKRLLFVCGPHEILVFSGRSHVLPDGSTSNYKILHGGRGFRIPFLEVVRRMDMRLFPVEVVVQNAYSSGGIPLTVRAIANVKLSSDPHIIRNAVERFLDYPSSEIAVASQQTLEGVLREVVSQLTPEEVNEDRLKFAAILIDNAEDDFDKLGLELDVLKIQYVSDDQEYLSNLGRAVIAKMLRDAENAENAADQAVAEAEAETREAAETATKRAETTVVQEKNNASTEMAELEARAKEAENQADMAAQTARVRAEQALQELRSELEKLRLQCDVVLPSEAERRAKELEARGQAAPAIENGKASAEALKLVSASWAEAGEAGRDVYMLQQLQQLASAAAERVARSEVGQIKLVAGDDQAYSTVLSSYPAAVRAVLGEIGEALGLDLDRLLAPQREETEAHESGASGDSERRRTLPPGLGASTGSPHAPTTQRVYGEHGASPLRSGEEGGA